jgi:hypothetical protein
MLDPKTFVFPIVADVAPTKDFVLEYAPKYWEAGNFIVTAMFGLAFAVYVALVNSKDARDWVTQFRNELVALALIGHSLLVFVIYRLYFHESNLLQLTINEPEFHRQILGAFRIRLGLFVANAVIYLTVIFFVASRVKSRTQASAT